MGKAFTGKGNRRGGLGIVGILRILCCVIVKFHFIKKGYSIKDISFLLLKRSARKIEIIE